MATVNEKAVELVNAVRRALGSGCRHYNRAGELLENEEAILWALLKEGGVVLWIPATSGRRSGGSSPAGRGVLGAGPSARRRREGGGREN